MSKGTERIAMVMYEHYLNSLIRKQKNFVLNVTSYTRMIKEDADNGSLEIKNNYRRWQLSSFKCPFVDLEATRPKLIEYFQKKGLKPPFLFHEERK